MNSQIAILTDYGVSDNYNGVIEAVIRRYNPDVTITYITPEVKAFNIYAGAYLLYTAYKYFRKGTIFIAIVDPGVGTSRKPIAISTKNYYFIGPDNGILYPSAHEDGINEVRVINNPRVYLSKHISNTFHGRDIFAVAAALLSKGVSFEILGDKIDHKELVKINYRKEIKNSNILCTQVIYIDHYGNITTSLKMEEFNYPYAKIGEVKLRRTKTFGEGKKNELIFYENGYGFLEIGINMGKASEVLRVNEGDEICLEGFIQEDFSHST
jgi:S-adenosylmethionine hydrolase